MACKIGMIPEAAVSVDDDDDDDDVAATEQEHRHGCSSAGTSSFVAPYPSRLALADLDSQARVRCRLLMYGLKDRRSKSLYCSGTPLGRLWATPPVSSSGGNANGLASPRSGAPWPH